MATKMNSISSSSSLNPGAREYVPRFLEAKKETERTAPETKEPLPPIESVPRDVRNSSFFFRKRGSEKKKKDLAESAIEFSNFPSRNGSPSPRLPLSFASRRRS